MAKLSAEEFDSAVNNRSRFEFFKMGLQYHIAARFLLLEMGESVAGIQAHHAIEMYLKGLLCPTTTEDDRTQLGHSLTAMWARAKTAMADSGPASFDAVVATLQQFEKIRYPERVFRKGAVMQVGWERAGGPVLVEGRQSRAPRYELFMNEVDALADHILDHANVSAAWLRQGLRDKAWQYLTERNHSLKFWGVDTSNTG